MGLSAPLTRKCSRQAGWARNSVRACARGGAADRSSRPRLGRRSLRAQGSALSTGSLSALWSEGLCERGPENLPLMRKS